MSDKTCKDCAYYNYVLCFDEKGEPNTNPDKTACKLFKQYISNAPAKEESEVDK